MAAPLTHLLKKDQFGWSTEAQLIFEALKRVVSQAPVLLLPNFNIPFVLETDASSVGMGAVLSQQGHPIAFFNKPFCPKLLHSSTYVRELFAITASVKKWRHNLLGHHFTILTDHHSLKELMSQVVQTPEQQMYLARLIGHDYSIQYRSGKSNVAADALSRIPENPPSELMVLSMPSFTFLDERKNELASNAEFNAELASNAHKDYTLSQGLILYKGCIWLPRELFFIKVLLEEFHKTLTGGHMGTTKT